METLKRQWNVAAYQLTSNVFQSRNYASTESQDKTWSEIADCYINWINVHMDLEPSNSFQMRQIFNEQQRIQRKNSIVFFQ